MSKFVISEYLSLAIALMYYMIGAYIKEFYDTAQYRTTSLRLIGFFSWILYSGGVFLINDDQQLIVIKFLSFSWQFVDSFFICGAALSIFLIYKNKKLQSNVINRIASTTFGIYLLHDTVFMRRLLWNGILKVKRAYKYSYFPFYAIVAVLLVFLICSFVDIIRQIFFEKRMLKSLENICQKITSNHNFK